MIEFIKNLFKKRRTPKQLIEDNIKMFSGMMHWYIVETNFDNPHVFESKINLKAGEYEDYLNRLLNSEFHVDFFDYHLKVHLDIHNDFESFEVISNNLKSELIYLDYSLKDVKKITKNFKSYTYIIKDISVKLGKIDIYKHYANIGKLEICVLKGSENGI